VRSCGPDLAFASMTGLDAAAVRISIEEAGNSSHPPPPPAPRRVPQPPGNPIAGHSPPGPVIPIDHIGSSGPPVAAIVGGVVAGCAALAVLAAGVWWFLVSKRYGHKRERANHESKLGSVNGSTENGSKQGDPDADCAVGVEPKRRAFGALFSCPFPLHRCIWEACPSSCISLPSFDLEWLPSHGLG
jgi:hypothetical protein